MPTKPVKIVTDEYYKKYCYLDDETLLKHGVLYIDVTIKELKDSYCIITSNDYRLSVDDYYVENLLDPYTTKFVIDKKLIKRGGLITVELFGVGYKYDEVVNKNNKFKSIIKKWIS